MKKRDYLILFLFLLPIVFFFVYIYLHCIYENLDPNIINKPTNVDNVVPVTNKYESNDYNIEYHKIDNTKPDGSWLIRQGKIEYYPWLNVDQSSNVFKYDVNNTTSYVPSYEDSVYFSRSK